MEQREPDLGKQLKGLWRRKWLILLTTVVAGGTAFAFAPEKPPNYEATATLMIENSSDPLARLPGAQAFVGGDVFSRDIGTQILIIQSRGVLERAIQQVEPNAQKNPRYFSSRVDNLRNSLKVRQVGSTRLVKITVSATDPQVAQELTNAVSQAYTAVAAEAKASSLEAALEQVRQKQDELGGARVDPSLLPELARLSERAAVAKAGLEPVLPQLEQIRQQFVSLPKARGPLSVLTEDGARYVADLTEALGTLERAREQGLAQSFGAELSSMSAKALNEASLLNAASVRLSQLKSETTVPSLASELQAMADQIDWAATDIGTARDQLDQLSLGPKLGLIPEMWTLDGQIGTVVANLQDLSLQMEKVARPGITAISTSALASFEDASRAASFALGAVSKQLGEIATGDLEPVLYGQLAAVMERIDASSEAILSVSRQLPRLQPSPAQEATLRDNLSSLEKTVSASASQMQDVSASLDMEAAQGSANTSQVQGQVSSLQLTLEVASLDIERLMNTQINSSANAELTIVSRRLRGASVAVQGISDQLTRAELEMAGLQEQLQGLERQLSVALVTLEEAIDMAREASPEMDNRAVAAVAGKMDTAVATLNSTTKGLERARAAGLDRWVDEDIAGMAEQVRAVGTWLTTLSTDPENIQEATLFQETQLSMIAGEVEDAIAALGSLSDELGQDFSVQGSPLTYADLAAATSRVRVQSISFGEVSSQIGALRSDRTDAAIGSELLRVDGQIRAASATVGIIANRLETLLNLGGDVASYKELDNLRQSLELSQLASAESGIRVVDQAVPPEQTSELPISTNTLLGGAAGLLLGVVGGLVLEYADRRVRDADEAKGYLRLPLLAQVPKAKRRKGYDYPSASDAMPPTYPESLRILRTNIELSCPQPCSLLITSAGQQEGKTAVAINLARVLAMQGRRVLLIDADLRKPDVARALGLPKGECMVKALANGRDPLDCVVQANGISVLACNEPAGNPAELLSSPQMKDLIHRSKERYDAIILDTAPVVGFADTKALSREVDSAILVLKANSSDLGMALEGKEALAATGTQVLGFVLNQAHQRRAGYGYYKAYRSRGKASDKGSP